MSTIKECEFCLPVENDTRTYRKQTEIYDGIAEVLMCWSCGYIALFERQRIIELLGIWDCNNDRCDCDSINNCVYRQDLIALIKGENK